MGQELRLFYRNQIAPRIRSWADIADITVTGINAQPDLPG